MSNFKLLSFVLLATIFINNAHSFGLGHLFNKNKKTETEDKDYLNPAGIWINIDKTSKYNSGEQATISGNFCKAWKRSDKEKLDCWSFDEDDLVVNAFFPDFTNEVQVNVSKVDNKGVFTYTTPELKTNDLNTFIFKVGLLSPKTKFLLKLKSKIEKRIFIIEKHIDHHNQKNHKRLSHIEKLERDLEILNKIALKIDNKLSVQDEILAEYRLPLQVDNNKSRELYYSSIYYDLKYEFSMDHGSLIEGEPASINTKITRVPSDKLLIMEGDFYTEYYLNNNKVKELGPLTLKKGESIDYAHTTKAAPNLENNFEVKLLKLYSAKNFFKNAKFGKFNLGKFNSKLGGFLAKLFGFKKPKYSLWGTHEFAFNVSEDKIAPAWSGSMSHTNGSYVNFIPEVNLMATDLFGRIDITSLDARLTYNNQTKSALNDLSLFIPRDAQEIELTGSFNDIGEGLYEISFLASDYAGNPAETQNYSYILDRISPVLSINKNDPIYTSDPTFIFELNVNDSSPVTTIIKHNDSEYSTTNTQEIITRTLISGKNTFWAQSTDAAKNQSNLIELKEVHLDQDAPVIGTNLDSNTYLNNKAFDLNVNVSDYLETDTIIKFNNSEVHTSKLKNFTLNLELIPGENVIDIISTDLAGNSTTKNITKVILDEIDPALNLISIVPSLTSQSSFGLIVSVIDDSPVDITVVHNGNTSVYNQQAFLEKQIYLEEGINSLEVFAKDAAGNTSSTITRNIILDTIAPVLSNISPINGSTLFSLENLITAISNEDLSSIKFNDVSVALPANKKDISVNHSFTMAGNETLKIDVMDDAGNQSTYNLNYEVILKVLNEDLIALYPKEDGSPRLIIEGSKFATRPGLEVRYSTNIFSSNSVIANEDGSFIIEAEIFDSIKLSATDPVLNKTSEYTLHYNRDTTLSGIVLDIYDNPLPGVIVTIQGTEMSAITGANGSFSISEPATGDHVLIFDGSNISTDTIGNNKKFYSTKIAVSIGEVQRNIIDRPIYLSHLNFDGTETEVNIGESVVLESPYAKGVSLEIPADTAVFPSGGNSGVMSVMEIPSDKTSVPPLEYALPDTVYTFEPSGLKFSEPVELTLPNVNEVAPGTQMIIMSKNSTKGIWEVDGIARVTPDGQHVVTEEGAGITHFSDLYATVIGPEVKKLGSDSQSQIDTEAGSLKTVINMPSFKVLNEDVSPSINYNSRQAEPSVIISNIFDIPRNEFEFRDSGGARGLFIKGRIEVQGRAWVEPNYVEAQFYSGNIVSPKMRFTGVPNKSVISYGIDLTPMEDGSTPYRSHFDIKLKQMIVGTKTFHEKKRFKGARSWQEHFRETRDIEKVFHEDINGSIFKYPQSSIGFPKGWTHGAEILTNVNSPKITLLKETTKFEYTSNNSIEELFNSTQEIKSANLGSNNYILLENGDYGELANSVFTKIYKAKRSYSGFWTNLGVTNSYGERESGSCSVSKAYYNYADTIQSMFKLNEIVLFADQYGQVYKSTGSDELSDFVTSLQEDKSVTGLGGASCLSYGGGNERYCLGYQRCKSVHGSNCSGFTAGYTSYNSGSILQWEQAIRECAANPSESGNKFPVKGFSDGDSPIFNNLKDIKINNEYLYLVDYGNNRVRKVNLSSKYTETVVGTGQTYDNGDGGKASNASLYHPTAITFDSSGNLYIASERGYIRKVDVNSNISTYAGKTPDNGGIFSNATHAEDMVLDAPSFMVIDDNREILYISDTGHHRVMAIDMITKNSYVVAGTSECNQDVSGETALTTSICNPKELGLDSNGNLLIHGSGNNKIYKVYFSNSGANDSLAFAPTAGDGSKLVKNSDGTFELTSRNGNTAFFNRKGKQIRTIDRVGREVVLEYDIDGRLLKQQFPTGQEVLFYYDGPNSLISSIIDSVGRETIFNYDYENRLEEVQFPDGSTRQFEYTGNLITAEVGKRSQRVEYQYDMWKKLYKTIDPIGKEHIVENGIDSTIGNNFTNGVSGKLTPIGDPTLASFIKNEEGQVTSFQKNEDGLVTKITELDGKETNIQRDIKGRIIYIKRTDDSEATFTYDPNNGDLISKSDTSTGRTINYEWDDFGEMTRYSDNDGNELINTYYNNGLLKEKVNHLGDRITYSYNNMGQKVEFVSTSGSSGNLEYGDNGNLISAYSNGEVDKTVEVIRDEAGNVIQIFHPDGKISAREYDLFNRLTAVVTRQGKRTEYEYDFSGNLTNTIDPMGNKTSYDYSFMNQLIKRTNPLGLFYEFDYDDRGRLVYEKDPNGNIKEHQYNDKDQLIKTLLPDNEINIAYNSDDEVETIADSFTQVDYTYENTINGLGVKTISSRGIGSRSDLPEFIISHNYNSKGQIDHLMTTYGNFSYEYNNKYQISKITNPLGEVFDMSYKDNGSIDVVNYNNVVQSVNSYTQNDLIKDIVFSKKSTNTLINKFIYQINNVEKIEKITTAKKEKNYNYNDDGMLTNSNWNSGEIFNYNYDDIGNRVSDNSGNYIYDSKNYRLKEDWKYYYSFDNNGNLTSVSEKSNMGNTKTYTYNSRNQLIRARVFENSNKILESTYMYDVLGRRIEKTVSYELEPSKNLMRRFVYSGSEILFELDESNYVLTNFTHSGRRTDDLLSMNVTHLGKTKGVASNSGTYYFVKDALGTITDITDSNGNLVQSISYSPYGKINKVTDAASLDITNNPVIELKHTYTGREYDSEIEAYYLRARHYDPSIGRMLQEDPHPGVLQSPYTTVNRYIYSLNDPVSRRDSSGRFSLKAALRTGAYFMTGGYAAAYYDIETSGNYSASEVGFALTVVIISAGIASGGAASAAGSAAAGAFVTTTAEVTLTQVVVGALAGAAVGGAAGAAISIALGADVKRGIITGAISGAISGGVAGYGAGGNPSAQAGSNSGGTVVDNAPKVSQDARHVGNIGDNQIIIKESTPADLRPHLKEQFNYWQNDGNSIETIINGEPVLLKDCFVAPATPYTLFICSGGAFRGV